MNRIYKVLIISLLIWATVSTTLFSYYYIQYTNLQIQLNVVENRIIRYKKALDAINDTLHTLNSSYVLLLSNYEDLLTRFHNILNKSVAILVIDYGKGHREIYKIEFISGVNDTAFEILKSVVGDIKYKYYEAYDDVFIECINGVCNHQVSENSGYYWMLYINFELSPYGAKHTIIHDGDIVIWNYTLVSW